MKANIMAHIQLHIQNLNSKSGVYGAQNFSILIGLWFSTNIWRSIAPILVILVPFRS
jgi:hypothetical protein